MDQHMGVSSSTPIADKRTGGFAVAHALTASPVWQRFALGWHSAAGRVFEPFPSHAGEEPYVEQRARLNHWLHDARHERLLVIEIGASLNTPSRTTG
jgi:hypothetical protein